MCGRRSAGRGRQNLASNQNWQALLLIAALTSYLLYLVVVSVVLHQTIERYRRFQVDRCKIAWRVHVNGIRGKSTTTRYIAAVFRERGYRTFGKTTGSAARILLPDGSEQGVQRKGLPNVNEQVAILQSFSENDAEAAVMECMAINPVYGEWLEMKVMQSSIGVITNIRLDHTDYLGETLEEIAYALARSIPINGILITAEQNPQLQAVLRQIAHKRKTRLITVDATSVDPNSLRDFNHFAIEDNIAIGYEVAKHIGLSKQQALAAMQKAEPDPGALKLGTLTFQDKTIHWANLFAVNDRESFVSLCERIFKMHPDAKKIVILNNRHDRQARVQLFTELAIQLNFSTIVTYGDYEKEVHMVASQFENQCQVVHCGNSSPLRQAGGTELLQTISEQIDPSGKAVLIGAVNIHTPQASRLMDAIEAQLACS